MFEFEHQLRVTDIILTLSVILTLIFSLINLFIMRRDQREKDDEIVLRQIIDNLDNAILTWDSLFDQKKSDYHLWQYLADSLSSFHNMAKLIKNENLLRCYITKIIFYQFRIKSILKTVDSPLFFYGVADFDEKKAEEVLEQSFSRRSYASLESMSCLYQYLYLGAETNGNYFDPEVSKEFLRSICESHIPEDIYLTEKQRKYAGEEFKLILDYLDHLQANHPKSDGGDLLKETPSR